MSTQISDTEVPPETPVPLPAEAAGRSRPIKGITVPAFLRGPWGSLLGIGLLALLLLVVAPALLTDFRLNNLAKYCAWAMVAVGIGLAWGRGGMLVLGQGVFFGLGAYAMGMHMQLETVGELSLIHI